MLRLNRFFALPATLPPAASDAPAVNGSRVARLRLAERRSDYTRRGTGNWKWLLFLVFLPLQMKNHRLCSTFDISMIKFYGDRSTSQQQ